MLVYITAQVNSKVCSQYAKRGAATSVSQWFCESVCYRAAQQAGSETLHRQAAPPPTLCPRGAANHAARARHRSWSAAHRAHSDERPSRPDRARPPSTAARTPSPPSFSPRRLGQWLNATCYGALVCVVLRLERPPPAPSHCESVQRARFESAAALQIARRGKQTFYSLLVINSQRVRVCRLFVCLLNSTTTMLLLNQ